jgi:hypothetical protein
MGEAERLYDATLDAELWPNPLNKPTQFIRGSAGGCFRRTPSTKAGVFLSCRPRARTYKLCFEKYVKVDPLLIGQFLASIEEPVAIAISCPVRSCSKTRIHREWAQPQRLGDCVTSVIDKSATSAAMVAFFWHQHDGIADEDMRRRVQLIVSNIHRAVIDLKGNKAARYGGRHLGQHVPDRSHQRGGPCAARSSLRVTADWGSMIVTDRDADQVLADIFANSGNGDAAICVKGISVPPIATDSARYVVYVLPLTSGTRRYAGRNYSAVAALFEAPSGAPSLPKAIAAAFKPTELRVLLAIVEVGGVPRGRESPWNKTGDR